jgi:Fe-S cluster assembly iron-binding protein IscA
MLRMNREAQAFAESVIATLGCAPILRVRVIGGGCAGLTWDFAVGDESTRPGDRKRRNGPLDVVVDGISAPLVDGALIELGEPGASGLREPVPGRPEAKEFILTGLKARKTCSCGESFTP